MITNPNMHEYSNQFKSSPPPVPIRASNYFWHPNIMAYPITRNIFRVASCYVFVSNIRQQFPCIIYCKPYIKNYRTCNGKKKIAKDISKQFMAL